MSTIIKTLYYKEYTSPVAYGYNQEHKVKSYIKIEMAFNFKYGLRFSASVPNVSYCYRNPFKAIMRILEHESIGMSKYDKIKSDIRQCDLWNKIDCK